LHLLTTTTTTIVIILYLLSKTNYKNINTVDERVDTVYKTII